jgi:hypothetical protein
MMSDESRAVLVQSHIADETADDSTSGTASALVQLCRAVVRVLPASGAAVSLITEAGPAGIVASSDSRAATIEELQFTLGESPGWDAYEGRAPVFAPDLAGGDARLWPGYAPSAIELGVRAVFAFPLIFGNARLGVLDIYRDQSSGLNEDALAYANAFCTAATGDLLDGQEQAGWGATPRGVDDALDSQFTIYQAQGMVKIQLGVSVQEAMSRMRAYAYSHELGLGQVAREIVARTLDLREDQR